MFYVHHIKYYIHLMYTILSDITCAQKAIKWKFNLVYLIIYKKLQLTKPWTLNPHSKQESKWSVQKWHYLDMMCHN